MNKRNTYFITLGFLFLVFSGYSQQKEKIKFGIKYGLNFPLMKGENYFSTQLNYKFLYPKWDIMYYGGLLLDVPVVKHFSIQTEVLYSTTGYTWVTPGHWPAYTTPDGAGNTSDPDQTEKLSFISIPLILKLKFGGFALYTGPQLDLLLTANRKETFSGQVNDVKKDYQSKASYSAIAGVEYTFRFGLGISARYQAGLTNIAQATETGLYEEGNEVKNQLIMFGPYFKFGKARPKPLKKAL